MEQQKVAEVELERKKAKLERRAKKIRVLFEDFESSNIEQTSSLS